MRFTDFRFNVIYNPGKFNTFVFDIMSFMRINVMIFLQHLTDTVFHLSFKNADSVSSVMHFSSLFFFFKLIFFCFSFKCFLLSGLSLWSFSPSWLCLGVSPSFMLSITICIQPITATLVLTQSFPPWPADTSDLKSLLFPTFILNFSSVHPPHLPWSSDQSLSFTSECLFLLVSSVPSSSSLTFAT